MSVLTAAPASQHGSNPALVDAHGTTTWRDLDDRVNRLISGLRTHGLAPGDTIALMAGNQRETLEVALACLQGGWLMVPVNWHWVAAELAHVISDSDAVALVVGQEWIPVALEAEGQLDGDHIRVRVAVAKADHVPAAYVGYEDLLSTGDPAEPDDQQRGGVMFYTSGTTGHPKGVRGGLAQVGGPVEIWQLVAASLGEIMEPAPVDPVQLVCGPAYHSAQWVFAVIPLLLGATVVLQHRFDPAEVLVLVDRHRVTNIHLVPAQFTRLLKLSENERSGFSGASLHRVHHGAAPCPTEVKRQMIEWWGPIITEYYGCSESIGMTMTDSAAWLAHPGTVGRPIYGVLHILDEEGRELAAGEEGTVYFSDTAPFSYHNDPERTRAACNAAGWATVGDVGRVDAEGFLYLTDRRSNMIISGGVNVYPQETENVLMSHPAVADVAVIGVPDDDLGEEVRAVVQLEPGIEAGAALAEEMIAFCRERLSRIKCPRAIDFRADLPREPTGKLLKRLLRDEYRARHASGTG